jgi:hypothetical protein
MKKVLIAVLVAAVLALILYYGVLYGLVSIVLFISDVIVQLSSLIW